MKKKRQSNQQQKQQQNPLMVLEQSKKEVFFRPSGAVVPSTRCKQWVSKLAAIIPEALSVVSQTVSVCQMCRILLIIVSQLPPHQGRESVFVLWHLWIPELWSHLHLYRSSCWQGFALCRLLESVTLSLQPLSGTVHLPWLMVSSSIFRVLRVASSNFSLALWNLTVVNSCLLVVCVSSIHLCEHVEDRGGMSGVPFHHSSSCFFKVVSLSEPRTPIFSAFELKNNLNFKIQKILKWQAPAIFLSLPLISPALWALVKPCPACCMDAQVWTQVFMVTH